MNKKTLSIFLVLLVIIVVMISALGRRVSTRQAALVAPEEGTVLAMAKKTRAIDRSTRHVLRSTPKTTAASTSKKERVYRRGRKPLRATTVVAAASTGKDGGRGVTVPGSGVLLWRTR